MDDYSTDGILTAIARAGSQQKLADSIGVPQTLVSKWRRNITRPPPELLLEIESKTGVAPSVVRPDLKAILAR